MMGENSSNIFFPYTMRTKELSCVISIPFSLVHTTTPSLTQKNLSQGIAYFRRLLIDLQNSVLAIKSDVIAEGEISVDTLSDGALLNGARFLRISSLKIGAINLLIYHLLLLLCTILAWQFANLTPFENHLSLKRALNNKDHTDIAPDFQGNECSLIFQMREI